MHWPEFGIPPLIAEVLSPATARYDRVTKRIRYQLAGVATYWIIDLDSRRVERWRPGDDQPDVVAGPLDWQPNPALSALTIDLPAYFREVWTPPP